MKMKKIISVGIALLFTLICSTSVKAEEKILLDSNLNFYYNSYQKMASDIPDDFFLNENFYYLGTNTTKPSYADEIGNIRAPKNFYNFLVKYNEDGIFAFDRFGLTGVSYLFTNNNYKPIVGFTGKGASNKFGDISIDKSVEGAALPFESYEQLELDKSKNYKIIVNAEFLEYDETSNFYVQLGEYSYEENYSRMISPLLITEKQYKKDSKNNEYEIAIDSINKTLTPRVLSIVTSSENPNIDTRIKYTGLKIIEMDKINDLKKVTGVSISPEKYTIKIGKSKLLYPNVQPDTAVNKKVTYKSSDPSTVKVFSNGKIQGIKPGVATITAITDDGGFIAESIITVE